MSDTSYGTRLSVPERPEPVAVDLIDAMRTAYRLGRGFIWDPHDAPPDPPPQIDRRLRTLSQGAGASLHALHGAFQLGCARPDEGSRKKRSPLTAHLASAQQQFTQAFLAMPEAMRRELFEEGHRIGVADVVEWRTTCSGAMAAARVASVLAADGLDVYLPSVRTDMADKVDLVAYDAQVREGVCLQVKNDHGEAWTSCTTYPTDDLAAAAKLDPYLRDFIRGVRAYGARTGGKWHALLVRVGSKSSPFHELQCPGLQSPLRETLAHLLPPSAARLRTLAEASAG